METFISVEYFQVLRKNISFIMKLVNRIWQILIRVFVFLPAFMQY